jgi:hypothetical protein
MFGALFGLIPGWAKLSGIGLILVSLFAWHSLAVHKARNEGRAEVQAKWDKLEAERSALAAKDALRRDEANLGVGDAYEARRKATAALVAAANARAAAATADADGLRDAIRRLAENPAPDLATARERAERFGRLLSECAGVVEEGERLVEESQGRVAALNDKVAGLQDYAAKVCVSR